MLATTHSQDQASCKYGEGGLDELQVVGQETSQAEVDEPDLGLKRKAVRDFSDDPNMWY